jgi:hypothetical protein
MEIRCHERKPVKSNGEREISGIEEVRFRKSIKKNSQTVLDDDGKTDLKCRIWMPGFQPSALLSCNGLCFLNSCPI